MPGQSNLLSRPLEGGSDDSRVMRPRTNAYTGAQLRANGASAASPASPALAAAAAAMNHRTPHPGVAMKSTLRMSAPLPDSSGGRAASSPLSLVPPVPEPLIICSANRRGGCGKTTNAAAIGYALAHRGYNVMLVDMDPQTDLSQFLLAPNMTECATEYTRQWGEIKAQKMEQGMSKKEAYLEAVKEASALVPHGYNHVIDRRHIPNNAGGEKVRTLWEAMENYLQLEFKTVPKEIEPFEILGEDASHGRLLLIPGHEDMVQMEHKVHLGDAVSSPGDTNIVWLSVPHHVLKNTAKENG